MNLDATECDLVASGNVGCSIHIQSEAARAGKTLTLVHPISLLFEAHYGNEANGE